jgi:hypothetical protein
MKPDDRPPMTSAPRAIRRSGPTATEIQTDARYMGGAGWLPDEVAFPGFLDYMLG